MRKSNSSSKIITAALAAAALCMAAGLTLGGASAYFTTYVSAGGSHEVHLGGQTTEIQEEVSNMTKNITVTNTSQTEECFVRVKMFYGTQLTVTCTDRSDSGNLWNYSEEDGYWYYTQPLAAGASTEVLDAKIDVPDGFDKDEFNVVVVQECTPVIYDENNHPSADWSTVYTDYEDTAKASGTTTAADDKDMAKASGTTVAADDKDTAKASGTTASADDKNMTSAAVRQGEEADRA